MKNMMQSVTKMETHLVKERLKTKVDTIENNMIGAKSMMEINKHKREIKPATMKNPLPPNNQVLRHHMERDRGGCMQMR